MAGRQIQQRGMTDGEFSGMTEILNEDLGLTKTALRLRAWFTDLAVIKYMAGYHCGYKRAERKTLKEHFDEETVGENSQS